MARRDREDVRRPATRDGPSAGSRSHSSVPAVCLGKSSTHSWTACRWISVHAGTHVCRTRAYCHRVAVVGRTDLRGHLGCAMRRREIRATLAALPDKYSARRGGRSPGGASLSAAGGPGSIRLHGGIGPRSRTQGRPAIGPCVRCSSTRPPEPVCSSAGPRGPSPQRRPGPSWPPKSCTRSTASCCAASNTPDATCSGP